MGADLFITPLYQRQPQQWQPQFEAAVKRRDSLKAGSKAHRQAQAKVSECYEKLNEQGYFRDPYNDWDLLWKFGLSWWGDVIPMLDDKDCLTIEQIRNLLAMLKERENVFELKVAQLPPDDQRFFRRQYASLQSFLNQAIDLNTPVETWL